jgi:HK97 family phage prohead protease
MADSPSKPYGDVEYADPGYLDADGNQASKSGKKGQKRYPLTADKVTAAWSYINQAKNAGQYTPEQLASIKSRIQAAMKKFGHEVSSSARSEELLPSRPCDRAFVVEDLHVRADGSGRVVEAYAAAFNVPTEIMDQDGHYDETLASSSFTKTISDKGPAGFGVLFNHGRTVDGTPNALATMPIGVPLEVRADERGVYTATRYLDNPLANDVLDAIKQGAIKAQSFSGRFMKSVRSYPNGRGRGARPLITRHEVDMREYGPAVFAAYKGAAILGTRAEQFIRTLLETPPDKRLVWLEQFEGLTTPLEPEALPVGTPSGAAALAEEPHQHSARSMSLRTHIRRARIVRGME